MSQEKIVKGIIDLDRGNARHAFELFVEVYEERQETLLEKVQYDPKEPNLILDALNMTHALIWVRVAEAENKEKLELFGKAVGISECAMIVFGPLVTGLSEWAKEIDNKEARKTCFELIITTSDLLEYTQKEIGRKRKILFRDDFVQCRSVYADSSKVDELTKGIHEIEKGNDKNAFKIFKKIFEDRQKKFQKKVLNDPKDLTLILDALNMTYALIWLRVAGAGKLEKHSLELLGRAVGITEFARFTLGPLVAGLAHWTNEENIEEVCKKSLQFLTFTKDLEDMVMRTLYGEDYEKFERGLYRPTIEDSL